MRMTTVLIAASATLVLGCSRSEPQPKDEPSAAEASTPEPAADPRLARLAALPEPYKDANLDNGARRYRRCSNCHMIAPEGRALVGPNLYGVFGRRVGDGAGFTYSPALENATFQWTPEQLDAWLTNPRDFLPGNRMAFAGEPDVDDRRDVIAHIMIEGGYDVAAGAAGMEDAAMEAPASEDRAGDDGYTVVTPQPTE